jgi:hypothetical protein
LHEVKNGLKCKVEGDDDAGMFIEEIIAPEVEAVTLVEEEG